MTIIPITHPDAIPLAVAAIERGQLIVVPTDTVYGVACSPFNQEAIERLYIAKRRPHEKAIQVLLADVEDATLVAERVTPLARVLGEHFWPGALTLTLPKRQGLPPNLSIYDTVGVRIPDHDHCRALIRAAGGALAATSANLSGGANPTSVQDAVAALGDAVAIYLDGGRMPGGIASTVVELRGDTLKIVRQGPITQAMLDEVLAGWQPNV